MAIFPILLILIGVVVWRLYSTGKEEKAALVVTGIMVGASVLFGALLIAWAVASGQ